MIVKFLGILFKRPKWAQREIILLFSRVLLGILLEIWVKILGTPFLGEMRKPS